MDVDTYTKIWMGGIIAFGLVFYAVAIRYAKHCSHDE
jgi:hypothetical protein